jgi:CBS domain-containing protein
MKVSDIMTRDVHLLSPEQTIREAASIMADIDAGGAAGRRRRSAVSA